MIKVKKLEEGENLFDLIVGQYYIGEAKEDYIYLNDDVKIKTSHDKDGFVPVFIKRISPPNRIEIDIVDKPFTVVDEVQEDKDAALDNETMNKLKPNFKKAAGMIKKAVKRSGLIMARHHDDCDGYSGALALEEAIMPLVEKETSKTWQNYRRQPMTSPYYDYMDAIRDLSTLKDSIKYGKKPLLLLIDNGSGEEDLKSLKKIKQYDVDIIVIDHHIYSEEVNDIVDLHVNPRLFGAEGDITSGMMGYEIAKILGEDSPIYAAVSGIADHSCEEFLKPYLELSGKSKEFLVKLAKCVDFEAYNLKHMDSDVIYDLFNDKQSETMDIIYPEIERVTKDYEKVVDKFLKEKDVNGGKLYTLDVEKSTLFREYPGPGKVAGIAHRMRKGPHITLGLMGDMIIFRVDEMNFSITKLLEHLKKEVPYGMVKGGGHDYAGAVKFVPAVREEVEKAFFEFLK